MIPLNRASESILEKMEKCTLLVLDFDGVLTDNCVYVDSEGREMIRCSKGDAMGLGELRKKTDVKVVILSLDVNPLVLVRAKKMKIPAFNNLGDKLEKLRELITESGYSAEQIAYVGNDVNDRECLEFAGLAIAVADSHPDILDCVDYVTKANGGNGAVREICDLIIKAKEEL